MASPYHHRHARTFQSGRHVLKIRPANARPAASPLLLLALVTASVLLAACEIPFLAAAPAATPVPPAPALAPIADDKNLFVGFRAVLSDHWGAKKLAHRDLLQTLFQLRAQQDPAQKRHTLRSGRRRRIDGRL